MRDADTGRYQVALDSAAGEFVSLKPANLIFPATTRVTVVGLEKAMQHNGKMGKVLAYDAEAGRYTVELGGQSGVLSLKRQNCRA